MTTGMLEIHESSKRRESTVDLLAIIFGIGAWISVNGLWVELPLLVSALPEGWALPSYMSVVIQIANIGPILYSVLHIVAPRIVCEKPSIYLLMVIGTLSSFLIAFFWDATTTVSGVKRSTGLLLLLFLLSIVDCPSSVLFMPFMARFRSVYLTSYLIGEGLSGFIPSIVALIQGVGGNPECSNVSFLVNETESWKWEPSYQDPRFSVFTFFIVLMTLMMGSAFAFIGLIHCKAARREMVEPSFKFQPDDAEVQGTYNQTFAFSVETIDTSFSQSAEIPSVPESAVTPEKSREISLKLLFFLLFLQAWVCALSNGGLPSIQSYSCLPYGNVAYHLAVTLSAMANPACCLMAYFFPMTSVFYIVTFTILGTGVSAYITLLAKLSPSPVLVGYPTGEALMVVSWIACAGLLTYVKVSIAFILRKGNGNQNLFWFGVSTQIGSSIGSIIAFVLINVYNLFQPYYPCALNNS